MSSFRRAGEFALVLYVIAGNGVSQEPELRPREINRRCSRPVAMAVDATRKKTLVIADDGQILKFDKENLDANPPPIATLEGPVADFVRVPRRASE